MSLDLAHQLADPPFVRERSPWDDHEHTAGYAVMAQPMSSGHVLGLRVFPRTDFGGYESVWIRTPDGSWSQLVDHAPPEHGCPRVWGPALAHAEQARIDVSWTGPATLRVQMDQPALEWHLELGRTPALAVLNALHAWLPMATWRARTLVRMRERVARWLGLGAVAMAGRAPTGANLVAVLRRMYWVTDSRAVLDGTDLGSPAVLEQCPTIGGWPLPRRGVFAIGAAEFTRVPPHRIQIPS